MAHFRWLRVLEQEGAFPSLVLERGRIPPKPRCNPPTQVPKARTRPWPGHPAEHRRDQEGPPGPRGRAGQTVNWAHVGDVGYVAGRLAEARNFLAGTEAWAPSLARNLQR